jgi:hypothetical protein
VAETDRSRSPEAGEAPKSAVTAVFSWLLVLLPAVFGLLYVRSFGVNVAVGDQWRVAHLFGKLASGTLGFADLWNQLNEHRILVPRIVILFLGRLTEWNNVAEMYATQVLLLVVVLAFLRAFRSDVGTGPRFFFFIPVPFLVFSFRQSETMLMGLLVQFALVLVFAVLAFYSLRGLRARTPSAGSFSVARLAFPLAVLSATLSSLSSAHGLLVWPVGLAQLLLGPARGRTKPLLAGTWAAIGAVEWAVYFLGYETPDRAQAPSAAGEGLLYPARFFVTSVGGALWGGQGPALAVGTCLLLLVGVALFLVAKSGEPASSSFWLALMLFACLVLASVTVGRAERGIEQALVSRYATYSIVGVVGLYGTLAGLYLHRGSRAAAVAFTALLALVLLSLPVAYARGIEAGRQTEEARQWAASAVSTYDSQPDGALALLYPNPQVVRKRAPELERLGYNVFSE